MMRKGYQCCCQLCAKREWCRKNPTKGRQCCDAQRRLPQCHQLISSRWCCACSLWVGQTEKFGPDEPPLPGMEPAKEEPR